MKTLFYTLSVLVMLLFATTSLEAQRRTSDDSNARESNQSSKSTDNRDSRGGSPANNNAVRPGTSSSDNRSMTENNNARTQERSYSNNGRNDRDNKNDRVVVIKKNREVKHYPSQKTIVVTHRPDRFENDIHREHDVIRYRDIDYSYYNGRYYRPQGSSYIVVAPPRGIRVRVIPNGYFTIMAGNFLYYYFQGVYYRMVENNYEVVDPPMGAIVPDLPSDDVRAVIINGKTYFEYDNILYKAMVTDRGLQYKVIGTVDDSVF